MQKILFSSLLVLASCNGVGHATLSWNLAYSDDLNTLIPCASGNAESVVLTIGSHTFNFDCQAGDTAHNGGSVRTGAIPWGTYHDVTVQIYIADASGNKKLEDTETLADAVEIDAGGTTNLPLVLFKIPPPPITTGTVVMNAVFSYPDTDANAQHRGCYVGETVKIDFNDGSQPYEYDCTANQTATIPNVPAGTYNNVVVSFELNHVVENGPQQTGATSFSADNSAPEQLQFGGSVPSSNIVVTAGGTTTETALFYVNRCSFDANNGPCQ